jgi:hypothetical protein
MEKVNEGCKNGKSMGMKGIMHCDSVRALGVAFCSASVNY